MIVVLIDSKEPFSYLFDEMDRREQPYLTFDSFANMQRWLETNPEPAGLMVDLSSDRFNEVATRLSLRYPKLPLFSLVVDSRKKLVTNLRSFLDRVADPDIKKSFTKILFVDDSKTVCAQYQQVLEERGFKVDTANSAEEGRAKALMKDYDLAIIDYYMPGGTGAELCQALSNDERTHDLSCAILTAEYQEDVVDACLNAGAKECMFKNESSELFIKRVEAMIRLMEGKRQVERERSRLVNLLYSLAEGVYGVAQDGKIQFVNPAALRLLGQKMSELMGRFPHEVVHPIDNNGKPTDMAHCFLQQAYAQQDELKEWRTLFQRGDGSLFPVECSVSQLGDDLDNSGSVVVFRDISDQQRLEKNWQWQLSHDHLTGLLNRGAFEDLLGRELNRLKRSNQEALLFFIDLDKFKLINDELGHAAGDQLLVTLAKGLSARARETDYVGRLAGDEFVVLLTNVKPFEISDLAEQYRDLLENTSLRWEEKNYNITGSVGAVVLDRESGSINDMLSKADMACSEAKQKGRNSWAIYSEKVTKAVDQGTWYQRLKTAMAQDRITLLKQGVYGGNDYKELQGYNCLLRLKEEDDLISPALFLSNAKRFGVLRAIDRLVLEHLVKRCRDLPDIEKSSIWFGLSLSLDTLSDPDFREELPEIWSRSGLRPDQLHLQVGEEELLHMTDWKECFASLQEAGVKVVLSRFGLNAQSLLSLPQAPIDAIRLDTTLTVDLATSIPRCHLIDAIVKTAREHDKTVIATHAETAEDLELLEARDVDLVQGFYFGAPDEFG